MFWKFIKYLFLLIWLFLCSFPSQSKDIIDSFNRASSLHKGEFESLRNTRGLPRYDQAIASFDNVYDKMFYLHDSSLIFYHHDNTSLRIWAFTDSSHAMSEIDISKAELRQKVDGYRNTIGSFGYQLNRSARPRGVEIEETDTYNKVSTIDISQLLLPKEIEALVRSKRKLFIVPSQNIGTVPFQALVLPSTNKAVSELFSITLLPSLYDIDGERDFWRSNNKTIKGLLIGNPTFANDRDWVFPQLPGAELEVNEVSKLIKSDVFLGDQATKKNVMSRIESAEVVYFATHGVSSDKSALDDSFLALANGERLTAREIQSLNLDASLVVLSACQTGLGSVDDAGIIGLARAFKIAGAREVVVSLWNVDDTATGKLMTKFFNHYIQQETKDASVSLKAAVNQIKADYPEPVYWAPFVVINGKGRIEEN